MSFAHRVTNGKSSIAYFAEMVGMQEGIKQILEARAGRISVRRTSSPVGGVVAEESSCIDRDSTSVTNDIPSEHNDRFHYRINDK